MKKRSLLLAAALLAALPFTASAHKVWLQPSQTVLSGDDPWITVDAAVSNDLFYFNHFPLNTDNIRITAPDGLQGQLHNPATGKYRSVFDVQLDQPGTWRIAHVNDGLFATWKEGDDGKVLKRWRGNAETLASEILPMFNNPDLKVMDLQVTQTLSRVETFVTNAKPNETALQPSNHGIELLILDGHPNDLFAGETARFRLLLDGQPRAGLEIEIVRGGTRYRNAQEEIKLTSDAHGEFSVTWPQAGMYWLETSTEDDKVTVSQASKRRLSYVATLEVLPE